MIVTDDSERELLDRVRSGEPEATQDFFCKYEQHLLAIARRVLRHSKLRSLLDSQDLLQSAFRDFTLALREGKYVELDSHGISPLLAKFIRTRYLHHLERQTADRRDMRRVDNVPVENLKPLSSDPGPAQVIEHKDLLNAIRDGLSLEDRELLDQRAAGRSWKALAGIEEGAVHRLRMRFKRAVARVTKMLRLTDG